MQTRPAKTSTKIAVLILGLFALAFFILPSDVISYAQYQGRAAACKANLRQVGIGVQSYQASHGGKMPPTLKALEPVIRSQSVFVCPVSGYVNDTEVGYDYRFLSSPKGTDIICWDSHPHLPQHTVLVWLNHPNRNVLLADGQVRNMPETEFKQLHLTGQNWVIQ